MKSGKIILSMVVIALSMVQLATAKSSKTDELLTVSITLDKKEDATLAVMEGIKTIKGAPLSKIVFERGVYHFYPEKAVEKYCYISNHGDVLSRIGFDLDSMNNVTIDGRGSTFIFHGRIIPFMITGGENITIKNLKIDCADIFYSEGTIVATDSINQTVDVKFHDNSPYEIKNGEIVFVRPYYTHDFGQNLCYDADAKGPIYRAELCYITHWGEADASHGVDFNYKYKVDYSDEYIRGRGTANGLQAEEIADGVVRFSGQKWEMPPVGAVLTVKGSQETNRLAPGFKCNNTTTLNLERVTVYHSAGMAFLFENCEDIDMDRCTVEPTANRVVSSTADATHFVGCRGEINVRHCEFRSQLDDAMNVHGAYQEVMEVLDQKRLGVRVGHYQQLGFELARVGDKVGLVRLSDSFAPYKKLTVKSTEVVNGRYHIITFKENIPTDIEVGDLLENLSAYPKLLVENCVIMQNRARGILISTPAGAIIRNNRFSTEMQAILMPVESGYWYESGSAKDVVIEGNSFNNCGRGGHKYSVISFQTDDNNSNIAFENIKILNNMFNHYDSPLLEITNVDGLLFKGNRVNNSMAYPPLFIDEPAITVERSKNVTFKNNSYGGCAKQVLMCGDDFEPVYFY